MARVRVSVICAVVLLLAVACSGGEEKEKEKAPRSSLTAVSRPIVDIVPAASIGEDGQPVDPALVFAPNAPRITIVAQVAEVTGSPMDITWSQVTDKGEKKLFTHTVEVASFDAAYSVGKSPGTLTPGTYRVEATLEGESLSTQFEVEAPEGTDAAGESATSGPPASGDSGAVATPVSDVIQQSDEAGVFLAVFHSPVDPGASIITVLLNGRALGGGRLEGKAMMGGSTRTVSYPLPPDDTGVSKDLDFSPCAHPRGSDLPGTNATFEAAVYKGDTLFVRDTRSTTLGPDETPPVLEVTSNPPPRSKVEPGQTIVIKIVGSESRSGTWQTGVKQIKLTDFVTGAVLGDQIFGDQALPCAQKAWSKGLDVPYTVPENAPAEIRLVAEGFDFAEKRGSFGLSYFTGEVWEGTANSTITVRVPGSGLCGNPTSTKAKVQLVVREDGSVAGTWDITGCGVSVPHGPITGTVNDAGFRFPQFVIFTNGSLIPKVTPTHAKATLTHISGGTVKWVTTWNLTCKTCG